MTSHNKSLAISFDTDISRYRLTVSNPSGFGCSATPFQLLDKNISLFPSPVKHLKEIFRILTYYFIPPYLSSPGGREAAPARSLPAIPDP